MSAPSSPSVPRAPGLSWYFWVFWTAHAVSNLADGFLRVTLPLLAIQLTREPLLISGVAFALTLPWLMLSLPVGAFVDRWDRRVSMVVANSARVIILIVAVYILATQQMNIYALYVVAFCLGVTETVADTAAGAILPAFVPLARLEHANARLVGVQTITNQFIGPPLGSALAALGMIYAFGSSGLLYFVTLLLLLPLRGAFTPQRQLAPRWYRDIRDGLGFIRRTRHLHLLILLIAGLNFCWSAYYALIVLYAVVPGPMALTPFQYGVVLASIGMGGFIGACVLEVLLRYVAGRWLIIGDILGSLLLFVVSLLSANFYVFLTAGIIAGAAGSISNIAMVSLRQRLVPDALLGRVAGALRLFSYGALSMGAASAGMLAQYIGIRGVFLGCIVIVLILLVFCLQRLASLAHVYEEERSERVP